MMLNLEYKRKLQVAPMLAWTTPACRILHRILAPHALLYTEMVTPQAVLWEGSNWLWQNMIGGPVALQLGGRDPSLLAVVAKRAADLGYCEINLNIGCPSKRAQAGGFGACLLYEPDQVAQCINRIRQSTELPVSIKTRTRVDEQLGDFPLDHLVASCLEAGCKKVIVHARQAWLKESSPARNRSIPPLEYERVYRLKAKFPNLFLVINGGIDTLEAAKNHLQFVDGVMLGRIAYLHPRKLITFEHYLGGHADEQLKWSVILQQFFDQLVAAWQLGRIPRNPLNFKPLLGFVRGCQNARLLRQELTELSAQFVVDPPGAQIAYKAWTERVTASLSN